MSATALGSAPRAAAERAPAGDPVVVADRLTKEYERGFPAVDAVSLEAGAGEVVGVVGPNGAGKSTTLKMLATLIPPTAGSATIAGIPIADARALRPLLGVALQDLGLDPLMTGAEHFRVQAALGGHSPEAVAARGAELVELLGLEPYLERRVGAYSGGTQRRLALALALIGDPTVVIFDEPTAGLDPRARRHVWEVIEGLRERGLTVLFSTQYLEEADRLCDRIYLIDRGAIVVAGRPAELKSALGRATLTLGLAEEPPATQVGVLVRRLGASVERAEGSELRLGFDPARLAVGEVFTALAELGLAVRTATVSEPTLDDVFFHHTQRELAVEPPEQNQMDLGTRMHRGGGKRWG